MSKVTPTTVSVVIPVYNGSETIGRAIKSAQRQTHAPSQIIVVDDCSTDETVSVVRRRFPGVTLVQPDEHVGGAAARNLGVECATGDVVAYLDADDAWHADKSRRCLELLERKAADAVYCDFVRKRRPVEQLLARVWRALRASSQAEERAELGHAGVARILSGDLRFGGASTLMVTREAHEAVGGWDESFQRHQDWQYLIELLQHGLSIQRCDAKLVRKYEGDPPPGAQVEASSRRLREKYRDAVKRAARAGFEVERFHRLNISRAYLRAGEFLGGVRRLDGDLCRQLDLRDAALLIQAAIQGLSSK
jgi:glycosyltransferase involved in cell wall biosynthesis